MRQIRCLVPLIVLCLGVLALPGAAQAEGYGFTLGLMGGLGGSPDSDGFGNSSTQVLVGLEIGRRTELGLRAGQLDFDLEQGPFVIGQELTYVTLATEYEASADFYESGLFLGLGLYDLEPDVGDGEDAIGLNVGVSGDFALTARWSVLVEFSAHYADLEAESFFFLGHAGLAFHF